MKTAAKVSGAVAMTLAVSAYSMGSARDHCLETQDEGCGSDLCYVEPGYDSGWHYWPPVGEISGPFCASKCPNAHCFGGAPLAVEEQSEAEREIAETKNQISVAIAQRDLAALSDVLIANRDVSLNHERGAVQFVSACSADIVVAHYPLEPQDFAELRTTYEQRRTLAARVKHAALRVASSF